MPTRAQGRHRAAACAQNGTLIERNSFNQPPIHRVDMRLQKRFSLGTEGQGRWHLRDVQRVQSRELRDAFTLNESNAQYRQPLASTTLAYSPRMLQFGFRTQF